MEAYYEPPTLALNRQLLAGKPIAYICHRTSSIVFVPTALGRASLSLFLFSFNIGSVSCSKPNIMCQNQTDSLIVIFSPCSDSGSSSPLAIFSQVSESRANRYVRSPSVFSYSMISFREWTDCQRLKRNREEWAPPDLGIPFRRISDFHLACLLPFTEGDNVEALPSLFAVTRSTQQHKFSRLHKPAGCDSI